MMTGISTTQLDLPFVATRYQGKVRDVYTVEEQVKVFVATDRISAFDHVLPNLIPHKGQVLNQLAAFFLRKAEPIVKTHLLAVPDPHVCLGVNTEPYPVEVIVRAHLSGHAWRVYQSGARELCGVALPDGLRENDPLPEPIVTPSTKSQIGPDIDISETEIVKSGLAPGDEWMQMKQYALQLFEMGQAWAKSRGLVLADTKYEFGNRSFDIFLIDEIHTPDSSRYFWAEGFADRQKDGLPQEQLSKEFVREWLMAQGFNGGDGQSPPSMPPEFVQEVSDRYARLYTTLTGDDFQPRDYTNWETQLSERVVQALHEVGVKSSKG